MDGTRRTYKKTWNRIKNPDKNKDWKDWCRLAHPLQRGPLTKHHGNGDALQSRLGVEMKEQQLSQRLRRSDLLSGAVEPRVTDGTAQRSQQPVGGHGGHTGVKDRQEKLVM